MQKRIIILSIITFVLVTMLLASPGIIKMVNKDKPDPGIKESTSNPYASNEQFRQLSASSRVADMRDYAAGYMLGDCLAAAGCRVFIGTIRNVGNAELEAGVDPQKAIPYRKLDVDIDEWLLGPGTDELAQIKLTSATRPAFSKTSDGPWSAWEEADVRQGATLLVALWEEKAQRGVWGGKALEIALATSNPQGFSPLKRVVKTHKRYEAAPEEFVNVTDQLESTYDNFLLGYVMAYVKRRTSAASVDDIAQVLSNLQKNQKVPDYVQNNISYQLLGNFRYMSEKSRRAATESLVGAGASDNPAVAESAVYVLVRLAHNKTLDMRPFLNPQRRLKLIERYPSVISKHIDLRQGHLEFQRQLGIEAPQ